MLYLHTKETTATRWIIQQILTIACSDKRRDSRQLRIVLLESLSHIKRGQLHQVFQFCHATRCQTVEFIQIYQSHHSQFPFKFSVCRKVYLIRVICLQWFGHQTLAESGFQPALLFTYQQWSHTIGKGCILPHPLCHDRQHPSMEILYPIIFGRNTRSQIRQTFLPSHTGSS